MRWGEGFFELGARTTLDAPDELAGVATWLRTALRCPLPPRAGTAPDVGAAPGTGATPAIRLRVDDALSPEGYALTCTPDRLEIIGGAPAGVFYGLQTVRQLLPSQALRAAPAQTWPIPAVTITDHPRFPWRGVMLDVARHFMPVPDVLRFVDLAAFHKLNVLHLHLTDDQGWRLEVDGWPRLTEIGAWRPESMLGDRRHGRYDGRPHGGFYTADDLREIVAYAKQRQVRVVPEVDMPGHMQAAVAAYPELGNGFRGGVRTSWGISKRQPWFTARMAEHLKKRGRRVYGWDEILEGGAPEGAVIAAWRGREPTAIAVRRGHQVVACPDIAAYLDYRQSDDPGEPTPVGTLLTLEDVYAFIPGDDREVLGGQANVWTEHMESARRVDYMVYPRLCAFAEAVWDPPGRSYESFARRLPDHLERLGALQVNHRPLSGPRPWDARPDAPGHPQDLPGRLAELREMAARLPRT